MLKTAQKIPADIKLKARMVSDRIAEPEAERLRFRRKETRFRPPGSRNGSSKDRNGGKAEYKFQPVINGIQETKGKE